MLTKKSMEMFPLMELCPTQVMEKNISHSSHFHNSEKKWLNRNVPFILSTDDPDAVRIARRNSTCSFYQPPPPTDIQKMRNNMIKEQKVFALIREILSERNKYIHLAFNLRDLLVFNISSRFSLRRLPVDAPLGGVRSARSECVLSHPAHPTELQQWHFREFGA